MGMVSLSIEGKKLTFKFFFCHLTNLKLLHFFRWMNVTHRINPASILVTEFRLRFDQLRTRQVILKVNQSFFFLTFQTNVYNFVSVLVEALHLTRS